MANIVKPSFLRSFQLSKSCSLVNPRGFSIFSRTPPKPNRNPHIVDSSFSSLNRGHFYHTRSSPSVSVSSFDGFVGSSDQSSIFPSFVNSTQPSSSSSLASIPTYPCVKSACERLFKTHASEKKERAFFVSDLGVVERQYNRWVENLPNVQPFYAVKCNPDDVLLKALSSHGCGMDVASGEEMRSALRHGVPSNSIIFANPIKNTKDLKFAAKVGVKRMTFDNVDELYKIKEHAPNSELVLRLLPDDSGSIMRFGVKFGAPAENIEELLRTAKQLDLKIIGTSFHVGSGCFDATTYHKAIQLCRETFDLAERMGLPRFNFLDLGGGFPGNPVPNQMNGKVPAFETFAHVIRNALNEFFPANFNPDLKIIAEPGRYMATAWSTLFTYVQGKRLEPLDKANPDAPRRILYYINDGVYGSFNCMMFDHAHPAPVPAYRLMEDRMSLDKNSTAQDRDRDHRGDRMMATASSYFSHGTPISLRMNPELKYATARAIHSFSSSRSRSRDNVYLATFFGPTCDSMDCITKDTPLEELFVGDWVAFEQMGAYTNAAASTFNGMAKPIIHYCKSANDSPTIG